MSHLSDYQNKWESFQFPAFYSKLSQSNQAWIQSAAFKFRFSVQELKQSIEIFRDFQMWNLSENFLQACLNFELNLIGNIPQQKKQLMQKIFQHWHEEKTRPISFEKKETALDEKFAELVEENLPGGVLARVNLEQVQAPEQILGRCPVASPDTLCCNLQTLDAVQNCAFGCKYCSIQTFHKPNTITFFENLLETLAQIKLDSKEIYHIGTGQASDSLLWGNKLGMLDHLCQWLEQHPNVILELKSKSQRITYFLENKVPANLILTWSLNPELVIKNEEIGTASLQERLMAARKVADQGIKIGFHLHPIFYYENYAADYQDIAQRIKALFRPSEVVLISYGTLTFTKSTMQNIRWKEEFSKVLHIPFVETHGKYSYPLELKIEMFKKVSSFFSDWREQVFQYFCMEDAKLWQAVWGFQYESNEAFSLAMRQFYLNKIWTSSETGI